MIFYIPARSGSKRIKDKNIKKIGDFSLLNLAVIRALESGPYEIIVSSDSEEYLESLIENERIIKYKRPNFLASDSTTTCESLAHDFSEIFKEKYLGNICIIQPTNPFTKVEDIQKACNLYENCPEGSLVSVIKMPYKNSELFYKDKDNSRIQMMRDVDDTKKIMFIDGNFIITNYDFIVQNNCTWKYTKKFKPFYQNTDYTIDIDYPWMLRQAELLWDEWLYVNNQSNFYKKYLKV